MTRKYKLSAKAVDTRICAIYALDHLIDYIRALDPDLKLDEATLLTAIALDSLPELFQENPLLVNRFREAGTEIKRKRRGIFNDQSTNLPKLPQPNEQNRYRDAATGLDN